MKYDQYMMSTNQQGGVPGKMYQQKGHARAFQSKSTDQWVTGVTNLDDGISTP